MSQHDVHGEKKASMLCGNPYSTGLLNSHKIAVSNVCKAVNMPSVQTVAELDTEISYSKDSDVDPAMNFQTALHSQKEYNGKFGRDHTVDDQSSYHKIKKDELPATNIEMTKRKALNTDECNEYEGEFVGWLKSQKVCSIAESTSPLSNCSTLTNDHENENDANASQYSESGLEPCDEIEESIPRSIDNNVGKSSYQCNTDKDERTLKKSSDSQQSQYAKNDMKSHTTSRVDKSSTKNEKSAFTREIEWVTKRALEKGVIIENYPFHELKKMMLDDYYRTTGKNK